MKRFVINDCLLVATVLTLVISMAGCRTFNDSSADMREREDLLILREDLKRIQGRVEGLELEYRRILNEIDRLRNAVSISGGQDVAVQRRLDELQGRIQSLDAARVKDRQIIVDQLGSKIVDMLKVSSRSFSISKSASTSTTGYEHIVQNGETLSAIAAAYNVKARAIIEANNLENPDLLKQGQKLFIPK